jgi:hypothetical protein
MRWLLALLIVGLCSVEARSQSMEGWQRVPDAQLKFEADYAACSPKPVPQLPTGSVNGERRKLDQPQTLSFTHCMRQRGWIKP